MVDTILEPHKSYACAYIDDTAVHSTDWSVHMKHLEEVLISFAQAGVTLKLAKCNFGKSTIKFIGHVIGSGKISVIESKTQAVSNIPIPSTKKLLKSFLGMASYYREFIPNFAEIAWPLAELTKLKQQRKLTYSDLQVQSFNELKDALVHCVTLSVPRYDRPFIVQTDASEYAVGACLAQLNDNGLEQPLAYASAKLSEVQRRWSVIEKESYAVLFAMNKFGNITFGSRIDLYTDHNPLQYLVHGSPKSAKLTRWSLALQVHDIHVHYKKGSSNQNADCLSRVI